MPNTLSTYRRPLITGIIFGLLVVLGLLLFSDVREIMHAFALFDWRLLIPIALLAPMNYVLRFVKWSYYLRLLDLPVERKISGLIFASGLSMTITPGKLGELLKCYLLKEYRAFPVSVTSCLVMAERLTDVLSVAILASLGAMTYAYGGYLLTVTLVVFAGTIAILHSDALFGHLMRTLQRLPRLAGLAGQLGEFQRSAKKLLSGPALLWAVSLGVVSWGLEGLIVWLAVQGFGGEISILASVFAVAFSSIVGAISSLPGGLGVAEGSIVGLLMLAGLARDTAVATALVTRFSTLWLGVLIGVVALYLTERQLALRKNQSLSR